MEVFVIVNHLLIYIKFTLLEQIIRNTIISKIYAEDNKVHLKSKNKEMCHHLHMQIRCHYKIVFEDKFFKQFLIIHLQCIVSNVTHIKFLLYQLIYT